MKKSVVLMAAGAMLLASCSAGPGIAMKAPVLAGDTVFVNGNVIPDYDDEFADTVVVAADGSFRYVLPVAKAALVQLSVRSAGTPLMMYLDPSESVEVSAVKAEDGSVAFEVLTEGLNKGIQAFLKQSAVCEQAIQDAGMAANMAYASNEPEAVLDSLVAEYNKALEAYSDFVVEYFLADPKSPEAPFVMLSAPIDSARSFADALSEEGRNGVMKDMIDQRLNTLDEVVLKREAEERIKVGAEAPDFTLTDINGNEFVFSSLRGKFVLLDFWGTWCGWCVKGIPDLKAAHEKYGDRLVILSVACRDSEKAWKEGVEKHGMQGWMHVIEPKDMEASLKPTVMYNVSGYPTKMIIDPKGNILNITVGEDPSFYEELDKIMY